MENEKQQELYKEWYTRMGDSHLPPLYYRLKTETINSVTNDTAGALVGMYRDHYKAGFKEDREKLFLAGGRGVNIVGGMEAEEVLYFLYRETALSTQCHLENSYIGGVDEVLEYYASEEEGSDSIRKKQSHLFIHGLFSSKSPDSQKINSLCSIIKSTIRNERSVILQTPLPFTPANYDYLAGKTTKEFVSFISRMNFDYLVGK